MYSLLLMFIFLICPDHVLQGSSEGPDPLERSTTAERERDDHGQV